jgi:hypothetical protein
MDVEHDVQTAELITMNHKYLLSHKKCRHAAAFWCEFLFVLLVLALLICDTAAGLAGRLAGSLAFAATAILRAVTQIAGLNGLDMFHGSNLHKKCSIKC